jgi:hypothetical protein
LRGRRGTIPLDLVFRTERGTPVNPNHASRAFARLAAGVGLAAHPHLLRHALAWAMAAKKESASIIAAQLRHADGGALAQRARPSVGWSEGGGNLGRRPTESCTNVAGNAGFESVGRLAHYAYQASPQR